MSARCDHHTGGSPCGAVLESVVDRSRGVVSFRCPRCDRRKAGVCRDCPAPVYGMVGRALRCLPCHRAARNARRERYAVEHRASELRKKRRYARARYQADAEHRATEVARNRAWRHANPEKVAKQNRRKGLRQSPTQAAYRRKYHHLHPEKSKGAMGPRACLAGCGTIVTGRAKKCAPCKQAAATVARDALASGAFRRAPLTTTEAA